MVVIVELRDKGAPQIQHGKRKVSRHDTIDKQQAIRKTKSKDKDREGWDYEGTLRLNSRTLDVRDGLHQAGHRIYCRSRQ